MWKSYEKAMMIGYKSSSSYSDNARREIIKASEDVNNSGMEMQRIANESHHKLGTAIKKVNVILNVYRSQHKNIKDYVIAFLKMKEEATEYGYASRERMDAAISRHRHNIKTLRDAYVKYNLRLNDLAPSEKEKLQSKFFMQLSEGLDENIKKLIDFLDSTVNEFTFSPVESKKIFSGVSTTSCTAVVNTDATTSQSTQKKAHSHEQSERLHAEYEKQKEREKMIETRRKDLQRQLQKSTDEELSSRIVKLLKLTNHELGNELNI